jgi:hypothetical protein
VVNKETVEQDILSAAWGRIILQDKHGDSATLRSNIQQN